MAVTPWVPTVRTIKDGEPVDQATVNTPLAQLIQREQHLYEKFDEISGKSVLVAIDQPIHPSALEGNTPLRNGKLDVVYLLSDNRGSGVARGRTGFSSSSTKGVYVPDESNYTFGIVKAVSVAGKADLFVHGLCELPVDIDDTTNGLVEYETDRNGNKVSEGFEVGPYYLSRKYPGKITKNPAGIPVYVGYALSKRRFLLQPSVQEFSQFFINYRYNVLDRPVATPALVDGHWTIPTPDGNPNRLGWIEANEQNLPGYTIAEDAATGRRAKFFYYIPNNLLESDSVDFEALTYNEKIEADELRGLLPPVPSNFVELLVNGITQGLLDGYNSTGIYQVDDYGLWWFEDTPGLQPWANDLLANGSWTPDDWGSWKGGDTLRPRIFISFSKFNPAIRTQLVSSLRPFNNLAESGVAPEDKHNSSSFIQFYNGGNSTEESPTGDLLVKVTPQFITEETPAGQAIANLTFDQQEGKFVKAVTPVVSEIVGLGGITVNEVGEGEGKFAVSFMTDGIYGQVDSIEPVNSRLEFRGLNSYIKLPNTTANVPYGLIGKIVLTKGSLKNVPLNLTLQVFGDVSYGSSAVARQLALDFEYTGTTAANSGASSGVKGLNNTVSTSSVNAGTVLMDLTSSGGYTAYTPVNLSGSLIIPANRIDEDTVISFKLLRNTSLEENYTGNIGILGIYWGITND
jgi:hypothetical protein